MTREQAINIISKYIKIYGLSELKQTIYIMGTSEGLFLLQNTPIG